MTDDMRTFLAALASCNGDACFERKFSFLANTVSIVGVLISIYIAWRVRSFKRRYRRQETLKPIIRDLRINIKELREYLSGDFSNESSRIKRQLHIVLSRLKHIGRKTDLTQSLSILIDRVVIHFVLKIRFNEDQIEEIVAKLDGLAIDIEHLLKTNEWEIRNG